MGLDPMIAPVLKILLPKTSLSQSARYLVDRRLDKCIGISREEELRGAPRAITAERKYSEGPEREQTTPIPRCLFKIHRQMWKGQRKLGAHLPTQHHVVWLLFIR
jgi:hypothetical protein